MDVFNSPRRIVTWRLLFVTVLVVAGFLRLVNLEHDEVRTDEGNYAVRAIGWNDFMFSATLGTPWLWYQNEETLPGWTQLSFSDHPPLHFATIWLATRLGGIHLWTVRLPSALYGIGAIAVLMLLIARLVGRSGAIIAGAVLALLPWHIFISRQAIQESGVIFWISLTILVAWLADIRTKQKTRRALWWWAGLGATFSFGVLTKYSVVVVALPLAWFAFRQRWFQRPGFWLAPLTAAALLAPLAYYNWQLFLLRGHFDLQLSRFFNQDTRRDWPASHQAIWQGDPRQALTFLKNQVLGISVPALALLAAGIPALWRERRRMAAGALTFGLGGAIMGGLLALVTLNDYGRSSVLLPFYTIGLGVGVAGIRRSVGYSLAILAIGLLVVANLPLAANHPAMAKVVATFPAQPVGYEQWEDWRARQVPVAFAPRHFSSLLEWLRYQVVLAETYPDQAYVIDNRIAWFPLNWYFHRYTMYAHNAAFLSAGIFAFLNDQQLLKPLRGHRLRYIEAGPATRDSKAVFDEQTVWTDRFFQDLITAQGTTPTIIAADGQVLFKIWDVEWSNQVNVPVR